MWNAAKGAAGLLGVPGATTDVVDAQREHQTEELDWQLHTGDEGYTTDIPIQNENIHTGNLRAWSAGVARAVDAQEASPETQVAIVGAAIEAVSRFRMSASPSPHEAAAVTKLLGALSASRDSPLKQAVLARIDGASPVKLAEFDQARVSLKQTLASESPGGASPARNLNTSFSSVVGNIAPGGQMQAQPAPLPNRSTRPHILTEWILCLSEPCGAVGGEARQVARRTDAHGARSAPEHRVNTQHIR